MTSDEPLIHLASTEVYYADEWRKAGLLGRLKLTWWLIRHVPRWLFYDLCDQGRRLTGQKVIR